jgi:MurNAc alpha-1-phosphate uridylyltransferase
MAAHSACSIAYSPEPPGRWKPPAASPPRCPCSAQPFLVVNGDIWCDWDFARARRMCTQARDQRGAPTWCWSTTRRTIPAAISASPATAVLSAGETTSDTLTYAGIGVFWPEFFATVTRGAVMKLRPLLDEGIARRIITGERHRGRWVDVGTPERLAELDRELA